MTASYIAMMVAAALLIGMAIDILLNSTTVLNIASSLLIFIIAIILGLHGLRSYILLTGFYEYASLVYKLQNGALYLLAPSLYFFIRYYPRGMISEKAQPLQYIYSVLFITISVLSILGLDIRLIEAFPLHLILKREVGGILVRYNALHTVFLSLLGIGLAWCLFILVKKYRAARLIYQKKQIRYLLFGIGLIVVVTGMTRIFEHLLASVLENILIGGMSVMFAAFILYSVTRFKIINIRQTLLRISRIFLVDLLMAAPMVTLFLLIRTWVSNLSIPLFFLVLTPSVVILFRVYDTLLKLSSRFINRKREVKDLTEKLLDEIGNTRSLEELAAVSIEEILSKLNSEGAEFLIFNDKSENYDILYSSSGEQYSIPAFDPIFRHLDKTRVVYDREVLSLDPRFSAVKEMALRYFETFHCQLVIPLYIENQIYALINLKDKFDNSAYTQSDKIILSKFAKVVEVILNNLILSFKEQEAKLTNKDLSLASQIQESIFQKEIPHFPQMDVFAYQKPAKWVNGDYYLVEKVDDNKMGVIIADVSGKGVPAALISMVIHSVSRSQDFSSTTTNAIVSKINEVMTSHMSEHSYTRIMSFATLFCAFLDRRNKTLFYTNAAHFPMIIHDRDTDEIVELKANAKPLGIFADQEFYTETFDLEPNQTLVLYSDGIIEANNNNNEEFSKEKLIDIIIDKKDLSAEAISEEILREVEEFAEDQEQFDDITLIIIKI